MTNRRGAGSGKLMFSFITATWNPLGGECLHRCSYCWANMLKKRYPRLKAKYDGAPRIIDAQFDQIKRFKPHDFVFVCDMTDLFGAWVPDALIYEILNALNVSPAKFLLLTKNPSRYLKFAERLTVLGEKVTLGITIESDIDHLHNAESMNNRLEYANILKEQGFKTFISIEPVMKFSFDFARRLEIAYADFYAVGFDNYNNGLPEPTSQEVKDLIADLEESGKIVYRKTIR